MTQVPQGEDFPVLLKTRPRVRSAELMNGLEAMLRPTVNLKR